jgi:hypothetical protein
MNLFLVLAGVGFSGTVFFFCRSFEVVPPGLVWLASPFYLRVAALSALFGLAFMGLS